MLQPKSDKGYYFYYPNKKKWFGLSRYLFRKYFLKAKWKKRFILKKFKMINHKLLL